MASDSLGNRVPDHYSQILQRNLPNKFAGLSSKVRSDTLRRKPRFSALQRWFLIENRTIIKEIMSIMAIYDSSRFLQITCKGAPLLLLLGEAPLIGRLRYVHSM